MTRILLLGLDPETVDFSDPALPPGMTAEKVRAGIAVALKQFTDRGWESDVGFIRPDETAGPAVERLLHSTNYECVVVGGGVRLPPRNLALFEVVINAIRKAAPGAAIAFNHGPTIVLMRPPDGSRLEAELYKSGIQQNQFAASDTPRSQVPVSRETVHVGTGIHLSGNRVNQALTSIGTSMETVYRLLVNHIMRVPLLAHGEIGNREQASGLMADSS